MNCDIMQGQEKQPLALSAGCDSTVTSQGEENTAPDSEYEVDVLLRESSFIVQQVVSSHYRRL